MINKSEKEWKKSLTPEEFLILRKRRTEPPFTGALLHQTKEGTYVCAGCGKALFSSETKFDSGSGWPSFFAPVSSDVVMFKPDTDFGMNRTEVLCVNCGGHLGHVFYDGPQPTGQRYCINSAALHFSEKNKTRP
jgi:peptide-methionine (R)-S-oxide reductase